MTVLYIVFFLLLSFNGITADPITFHQNQNLQKVCGRIGNQQKTSEGHSVQPEEAPWTVGISYFMNSGANTPLLQCSGTLISSRHVLTAASCLLTKKEFEGETNDGSRVNKQLEVILETPSRFVFTFATDCSDHFGTKCQMKGNVIKRKGKMAWIPRKYLREDVSNIAVIELDSDVEFSDKIKPACFKDSSAPEMSESLDHYGFAAADSHSDDWGSLRRLMRTVKSCDKAPELEDNPDHFCTKSESNPCKAMIFGHGKELNISQVEQLCEQLEGFAAPIKSYKELQTANEVLKFYWNDFKRPRKDGLTVIGARRKADELDFRWTFDSSLVSNKPEYWADAGTNACLALIWYPSVEAPESVRFKDVQCDTEETQAVLCARTPGVDVKDTI